jgi:mannose-1-phosphate guanylyltransferase/phosphomannomutase
MLTLQEQSLGQIRAELPRVYHRSQSVRCPWTRKGALMRHLVETHPPEDLELIDGVKVLNRQHESWVLILPDAGEPQVHIFANGQDRDWVDQTLREYRLQVQEFADQDREVENLVNVAES